MICVGVDGVVLVVVVVADTAEAALEVVLGVVAEVVVTGGVVMMDLEAECILLLAVTVAVTVSPARVSSTGLFGVVSRSIES